VAGNPDDDESTLFREAVRGVRPLGSQGRAAPAGNARTGPRPPQRARRVLLDESAAAPIARAFTDPMTFRRPGTPEATMRRLRRGQIPVDAEIDLHGLTGSQGERALREFLERAIGARMRCVRVVHGKGLRSGGARARAA
jgi:DNA-nicking Smr family endonuclease